MVCWGGGSARTERRRGYAISGRRVRGYSSRAYRMIRELIPFIHGDGTLPADLEPLVTLVTTGTLTPPTAAVA